MTVGLLRRGEFACTGSAVARFKTATTGMWSCDEDGVYYHTGRRGRRDVGRGVVLRLHRRKEASLGLLGPSLFSSMI